MHIKSVSHSFSSQSKVSCTTINMKLLPILVMMALVICAACKNHEDFGGHRPWDSEPRSRPSNPYA
ncbi:uncharacterized protein LOC117591825 [Drosophila guanche]|uniref:uncharacterized protein LOC117591825 n=1 Tax=Drosophila guanche TaxID=7266 RepID=UPI0014716F5A|nr:uncharacterized protein LOC117591825 [Drosophila guanche]